MACKTALFRRNSFVGKDEIVPAFQVIQNKIIMGYETTKRTMIHTQGEKFFRNTANIDNFVDVMEYAGKF